MDLEVLFISVFAVLLLVPSVAACGVILHASMDFLSVITLILYLFQGFSLRFEDDGVPHVYLR
jgi:hypothetical protein